MDRIASGLNMSVLELFGFEVAEARRALKRSGVDDDALASAINENKRADHRSGAADLAILSIPIGSQSFQAGRLRRWGGRSLPIAR